MRRGPCWPGFPSNHNEQSPCRACCGRKKQQWAGPCSMTYSILICTHFFTWMEDPQVRWTMLRPERTGLQVPMSSDQLGFSIWSFTVNSNLSKTKSFIFHILPTLSLLLLRVFQALDRSPGVLPDTPFLPLPLLLIHMMSPKYNSNPSYL